MTATHMAKRTDNRTAAVRETSAIFGLRYLEEEAAEIRDVIGCLTSLPNMTGTGCDDHDQIV